ncbi:Protein of unknown function [Gryllus bimaculatus]|nr:Protein of unknown function [Gryllus bimaculatus]
MPSTNRLRPRWPRAPSDVSVTKTLQQRVADLGAQLLPDAAEALADADEDGDTDQDDGQGRSANDLDEEGRGKKKKKRKALMKLLFVAMLIKNKLGLLFQGFGALLQIKPVKEVNDQSD